MVAQVPLIQRLGARWAMENVGSGEPFTAERAREVGLINAITSADRLTATAEEWLEKAARAGGIAAVRSEEHTSELQSLMRISYAVFSLKKKNKTTKKL